MSVIRFRPERFHNLRAGLLAAVCSDLRMDVPGLYKGDAREALGIPRHYGFQMAAQEVCEFVRDLDRTNAEAYAVRYRERPECYDLANPHAVDREDFSRLALESSSPYRNAAELMKALQSVHYNSYEAQEQGAANAERAKAVQDKTERLVGKIALSIATTGEDYKAAPWGEEPEPLRYSFTDRAAPKPVYPLA